MKIKSIIILTGTFILSSCQNSSQNRYAINITERLTENIVLQDDTWLRSLQFETNPKSMLYSIMDIKEYGNGYLVRGREKICYFDKNGHFLSLVGQKGRGPGEYIDVSSYYVYHDTLSIYSRGNNSLLHYILSDRAFKYVGSTKIPDSLMFNIVIQNDLFPDMYITHNIYQGIGGVVPTLGIYDKYFNLVSTSLNCIPDGGRFFTNPFSSNDYGICFTDFLNYTIFEISNDSIDESKELYFGKNMIPERYDGINDKLKFLTTLPSAIAFPTFILPYKDYYIIKASYERIPLIIVLNKTSRKYRVFRTIDKNKNQVVITSISIIGDCLAISLLPDETTLDNPTVYLINLNNLLT